MVSPDALHQTAQRLFDAFVAHDLDTVAQMLSPDAEITQNGFRSNADEALVRIAAIRDIIGDHRYEDVRRVVGENAVVEEHRVVSTTPSGVAVDLAACVVVRVGDDGLITALDEYVDVSSLNGA